MNNGKIKYIFWQDDDYWFGYIEEYPDYITQGKSMKELQKNLKDHYKELGFTEKVKKPHIVNKNNIIKVIISFRSAGKLINCIEKACT